MNFIVYGLPRSGTAWASVWLTTEHSVCWHDPLTYCTPENLNNLQSAKMYRGIADTMGWMFDAIPGKRIILVRDPEEINESLARIGLAKLPSWLLRKFDKVPGERVRWTDLWNNPQDVWKHLLPNVPFDSERTEQLTKMRIVKANRPDSVPEMSHARTLMERMRHENEYA